MDSNRIQTGDMVWFNASNIPLQRLSKKLDHKYLSLYKVVKKIRASTYQLSNQGQLTRHVTFNEQYIRPFKKGIFPSQITKPAPPAELINRVGRNDQRFVLFQGTTTVFGSLEGLQCVRRHLGTCMTPDSCPRIGHGPSFIVPYQTQAPGRGKSSHKNMIL